VCAAKVQPVPPDRQPLPVAAGLVGSARPAVPVATTRGYKRQRNSVTCSAAPARRLLLKARHAPPAASVHSDGVMRAGVMTGVRHAGMLRVRGATSTSQTARTLGADASSVRRVRAMRRVATSNATVPRRRASQVYHARTQSWQREGTTYVVRPRRHLPRGSPGPDIPPPARPQSRRAVARVVGGSKKGPFPPICCQPRRTRLDHLRPSRCRPEGAAK